MHSIVPIAGQQALQIAARTSPVSKRPVCTGLQEAAPGCRAEAVAEAGDAGCSAAACDAHQARDKEAGGG